MHIAFDAKRVFYNRAGLGNYSRNLIEALATFYPDNQYTLFSKGTNHENYFAIKPNTEVQLPKGLFSLFPALWRSAGLSPLLKEMKPDLFHGLSHELPIGIQKTGIKSIVTMHDLIFVRFPEWYNPIDRFFYTRKYNYSCQISDHIIAIGNQTANDLTELWNIPAHKIDVVRQSCNSLFWQKVSTEEKERIKKRYGLPNDFLLQVGTIEPRKNHLSSLQSLTLLKNDIPLVIVGKETVYKKELMEFIRRNQLQNRVIFLHSVPMEHLPALYSLAKVSVYPSVFEGFGIPVLESLVCNTPVVTSQVACFEDAGGDAALYFPLGNPDALTERIDLLLNDSSFYQSVQKKAYEHIQGFTPQQFAYNTMQVYTKILKQ